MEAAKLAISMSPMFLSKVKAAVLQKRAKSLSAYIEHAVSAQIAAGPDFDLLLQRR